MTIIIKKFYTLTSHSSTPTPRVTTDKGAPRAVKEVTLTATASNIVQVDWTSTTTKLTSTKGDCICWCQMCIQYNHYSCCQKWYILLTLGEVAQLSTHHSGIWTSPGVITHSTPLIVHANLHSAFIFSVSSYQSQLNIVSHTWSYVHEMSNISGG